MNTQIASQQIADDADLRTDRLAEGIDDAEPIPALGCGTYQMNSVECFDAVRRALSMGYRHVDTAVAYDNEAAVGRAVDVAPVDRSDVFITTKVKGYPEYLSFGAFLREAKAAVKRLGVDYIDLLLVHWWHPKGDMKGTCAALDTLVRDDLVRNVGVSNFSISRMQRAMDLLDTPILTNQIEYHPWRSRDRLLTFCRNNDITVTAYSPLAEGRLVDDPRLARIGCRYDKTPAQVAIRWLVQQEGVVTIPKSSQERHLRENLAVFDFELTPAEMGAIAELDGPLLYRLNAEGGLIQRTRQRAGRYVPERIRTAIP